MKGTVRALARPRKLLRRALQRVQLAASIRPTDSFIVSYPKSGTTWVSFFMAAAIAEIRRLKWDPKDFLFQYDCVPGVDAQVRRGSLRGFANLGDPRVFRCHASYNRLFPKVVYLIRDPRDVMVSYHHHHRRLDNRFDTPIEQFILENRVWPGDWGAHVRGWLDRAPSGRLLMLRYEDLWRDPEVNFGSIARFCGYPLSAAQVERLVALSSFTSMRQSCEALEKRRQERAPFIRRGEAGGWRDELGTHSAHLIEQRYGSLMTRLGYQLSSTVSDSGEPGPSAPSGARTQRPEQSGVR